MTEPTPDLRIISRAVTADEIAAVTAVVQGALEELAAAEDVKGGRRVSAWERSQRSIRTTITPGPGKWRSFEG